MRAASCLLLQFMLPRASLAGVEPTVHSCAVFACHCLPAAMAACKLVLCHMLLLNSLRLLTHPCFNFLSSDLQAPVLAAHDDAQRHAVLVEPPAGPRSTGCAGAGLGRLVRRGDGPGQGALLNSCTFE